MQLTGWDNGNDNMHDVTCADTQISVEWLYFTLAILCQVLWFPPIGKVDRQEV